MKRDMNLVRIILKGLAESHNSLDAKAFTSSEYAFNDVCYHFEIMKEAGLIEADIFRGGNLDYVHAVATRLTWDGNDFLSSITDEKLWNRLKLEIAQKATDVPFEVMKQLAVTSVKTMFGL